MHFSFPINRQWCPYLGRLVFYKTHEMHWLVYYGLWLEFTFNTSFWGFNFQLCWFEKQKIHHGEDDNAMRRNICVISYFLYHWQLVFILYYIDVQVNIFIFYCFVIWCFVILEGLDASDLSRCSINCPCLIRFMCMN